MPKLKSKRGAKKRFKVTGTGKVMAGQMNKRHILTGKPKKRKRQLRGTRVISKCEQKRLRIALLA